MRGCLTSGRPSKRFGSSDATGSGTVFRGLRSMARMKAWEGGVVGTSDARPGPCGDRTCETDRMCARLRSGRAGRRLRMSLCGFWLHHGLRGGCAGTETEAVVGATHLFRCLPWHLRRLGCALHPNLRGGSLRASNPMREGHTLSRDGRRLEARRMSASTNASGHGIALARSVGAAAVGRAAGYHTEGRTRPHFARGEENDQSRTR